MDAGFAINSPYPLVLPPARDADLIISFDFSSGDPFEVTEGALAWSLGGHTLRHASLCPVWRRRGSVLPPCPGKVPGGSGT